jgi:multisubunit Na+/H+ antiporter MnhB subunit
VDIAWGLDNLSENSFEPVKRKKTAAMRKIKYLSTLIISLLLTLINHAQTDKAEMADMMRSNGRIYVVVAVVVLILVGLFLYLLRLDKKITRIEKNNS